MACTSSSDAQNSVKLKLGFLRNSLNLIRNRRVTIGIEQEVNEVEVPSSLMEEVTLLQVQEQANSLHREIVQLTTIKKSHTTITGNLHKQINCLDGETMRLVKETLGDMAELLRSIKHLDLEADKRIYQLVQKHHQTVISRRNKIMIDFRDVAVQPNKQRNVTDTESVMKFLKKINTTRIITRMLIACFFSDHEANPEIQKLRSPVRRDLTVDDFSSTWTVGYGPQAERNDED